MSPVPRPSRDLALAPREASLQRLKTQCPEERPLETPAPSRRSQAGTLPSPRPGAELGLPRVTRGQAEARPSRGPPQAPCADLQGRAGPWALGRGPGRASFLGLVPLGGGRGPRLRSPAPTVLGAAVTCQGRGVLSSSSAPGCSGRSPAGGLPGWDLNPPPVRGRSEPWGVGGFGRGPGLALLGEFSSFY